MRRAALATAALCLALAAVTAVRPVWTIDPDASLYLGLGQSLAASGGYALDGLPHTKYPPGFPVLLAAFIGCSGPSDYAVFHVGLVALLVAAAVLTFFFVRSLGYPDVVALAVAAAIGLSQTLFDLSVIYLRSEVPFLLVTLAALLALQRCLRSPASPGWLLVASALAVAAMSVRLAGVTLLVIPAVAIVQPGNSGSVRLRGLLVLGLGMGALLGWEARALRVAAEHPGAPDYSAEFRAMEPRDLSKTVREDMPALDGPGLLRRVGGNLDVLTRAMAVLLTNVDRAGARRPVGLMLSAVLGLGLLSLWRSVQHRRERRDAVLYVLAMLLLLLLWPFNQQERFYVPLLPLLLLAAGEGVAWLAELAHRWTANPRGRTCVLAAAATVLVVLAAQRSDHPTLLGRFSLSYAALLAAGVAVWVVTLRLLARGPFPRLPAALALAVPALFAIPWSYHRFVEWPVQVRDFEERRAREPQPEPLAHIDVDPRLEQVAVFLREQPAGTVLMTDVPSMLQVMSGRRCVPFVYRVQPPEVRIGDADLVFYSREIPEASRVMDAVAPQFEAVFSLPPVDDGTGIVTPAVYKPR